MIYFSCFLYIVSFYTYVFVRDEVSTQSMKKDFESFKKILRKLNEKM